MCVSPGSESKLPAGVLTVSLELYPPLTETLNTDIISTQVRTLESLYLSVCYPSVYSSASLFMNTFSCCELTMNQYNTTYLLQGWGILLTQWQHCKRNIQGSIFSDWCVFLVQQSLERQRTAEKERLFLVYAKQWWREFLEIRPSHQSKMVKIFAQVCFK